MKLSKAERHKRRTLQKRRKKSQDKFIYAAFWGCILLFIAFHYYKPLTIGNDIKYNIFIVILPILAGLSIFYFYRHQILDAKAVASVKNIWHKLAYAVAFTVVIALLSFMSLGLIANIIFDISNYYSAKNNREQEVIIPIDEFHKGKGRRASHKIYFTFEDNKESIAVSRNSIDRYIAESNTHKRIKLNLRKGLWNHYIVENWDVIR